MTESRKEFFQLREEREISHKREAQELYEKSPVHFDRNNVCFGLE